MADAAPFLDALAEGLNREATPEAAAAAAHTALQAVWQAQRTLVLDVQFTGFSVKGKPMGVVRPALLRAAGALIVHRVTRIGFTPEAAPEDLAALLRTANRTPSELAGEGIVAAIRTAAPRGVYLSTSGGEAYRPTPLAEAGAGPSAQVQDSREEDADLSAFEFVDDVEDLSRPIPVPETPRPAGESGSRPGMYDFFRSAESGGGVVEADSLPAMLHACGDMSEFERLSDQCSLTALKLLQSDRHEEATRLLDALVQEADHPERARHFRDTAGQALRRAVTPATLPLLVDLLQRPGPEQVRAVRVLSRASSESLALLENMLFRTGDGELRQSIFRRMLKVEGAARKAVVRSLGESPARLRILLELCTLPEVSADFAQRWLADAAQHQDATVRADVARHGAALGGRPGLRVLLDLLNDADKTVVRAALIGLATLGDPAAVPFLARLLNDADEALQLGAIAALGRTGSPDALPPLLALIHKRQLITTRRVQRLKTAAVEAIGRTRVPAARDVLQGLISGSDGELASAARQALSVLG